MGRINVLNKHVAELIAAGEVVDRPSSVIKELIENSIDAGANLVTVEIKNGGTTFMRITDNGCGIEKDDIKKAFLRNATSKISNETDLDNISTLGFRGEALASVCAVSKVEVITKTKNDIDGTHYIINGGEEELLEDFGCQNGTTIIVKDLFYNVPARMKFLKKDVSEANNISKLIDRVALSHPEVSFKFIRDNKEVLNTPGNGKVNNAIYSVYGKEFLDSLLEVNYSFNGLKLEGFVSKPSLVRANRNMQHFFINGRYVKTRTAMAALEEAFKGLIMTQKFPSCVLYLTIPFDVVDVNVHPTKLEVRFVDERPIFELVYHGVKTALMDTKRGKPADVIFSDTTVPIIEKKEVIKPLKLSDTNIDVWPEVLIPVKTKKEDIELPIEIKKVSEDSIFSEKENLKSFAINKNDEFSYKTDIIKEVVPTIKTQFLNESINEKNIDQLVIKEEKEEISLIGEVFRTYLVLQNGKSELVFIDKHAAHERLIYEKLKSQKTNEYEQMLLEPIVVNLSKDEYDAAINNLDLFKKSGFDIDDFGIGSVIVRSSPLSLDNNDIKDIIIEMAGYILENKQDIRSSYSEWLYKNIACRAAIKAGDKSDVKELISLYKQIQNENISHCPHGRPVSISFSKKDIEKKFGRI